MKRFRMLPGVRGLLLSSTLTMTIAGCSGDTDDDDPTTGVPASPTPGPTESPTPPSPTPPSPTPPSPTPGPTETPTPTDPPTPSPTPLPNLYPSTGVFIDAPVEGLEYTCDTLSGTTDTLGRFQYFEGELISFTFGSLFLGVAPGQHTVTLHDVLAGKDSLDLEVINFARLLQSFDQDGDPMNGITLSSEVSLLVEDAALDLGIAEINFAQSEQVQELIDIVLTEAEGLSDHTLVEVTEEEAGENLQQGLFQAGVWRRNISRTPTQPSRKPKLDLMTVYVTGRTADGLATGARVKPFVATYSDGVEGTGASDIFVAVSLDEAMTWKRYNVSQSAPLSSFTLADGTVFPGDAVRPQVRIDGNIVFATWPSKYCPSSRPGGLADEADLYGVNGAQRSVNNALIYERPDLGEVPFSCIWAARGWVDDSGMHWLKTEQVSSGTRDAIQNAVAGSPGVAFAHVWQEDPVGLNPGHSGSTGPGGTGATVNHGTDIWYSYLKASDFLKTEPSYDPANDPEAQYDDGVPRPRAQFRFSSPIRVTDNAECKFEEGVLVEGAPYCEDVCTTVVDGSECQTADGRWLHGGAGASRANIQLVGVQKSQGDGSTVKTATVLLAYEETKGTDSEIEPEPTPEPTPEPGSGDEDAKYVVYHNFATFDAPETIAAGSVVSDPLLSGRRVRFMAQGSTAVGSSDTRMALIYREGPKNSGCIADIMLRRGVGGYSAAHFQPALNLSSPTVTATAPGPYGEMATAWTWSESDLTQKGDYNTFDDARGLRLQLRGDFLAVGYTWTPNWELALQAGDHYDFYLRRSFDGGATWTSAGGTYQTPQNLSNLPDHALSVIEPRLVLAPATIKNPDGSSTGNPEDVQNGDVYFVAYGTTFNTDCEEDGEDGEDDKNPADMFYSRTTDLGESYDSRDRIDPHTGAVTQVWDWLAQGIEAQSEAQLRMTPDGSKLYMMWSQVLENPTSPQHDVWIRRIDYTP